MSRLLLALLASILCTLLTGCTSHLHRDTDVVTNEARAAAAAYWNETLTRCGENSYSGDNFQITQYKNFDYTLRDVPLTKSDQDSGVAWRMRTAVRPGTPYRIWDQGRKKWTGDWSNVGIVGWSADIENWKGKIFYSGATETDAATYQPTRFDCSTVPK